MLPGGGGKMKIMRAALILVGALCLAGPAHAGMVISSFSNCTIVTPGTVLQSSPGPTCTVAAGGAIASAFANEDGDDGMSISTVAHPGFISLPGVLTQRYDATAYIYASSARSFYSGGDIRSGFALLHLVENIGANPESYLFTSVQFDSFSSVNTNKLALSDRLVLLPVMLGTTLNEMISMTGMSQSSGSSSSGSSATIDLSIQFFEADGLTLAVQLPEPATLPLIALGLLGLGIARRRVRPAPHQQS